MRASTVLGRRSRSGLRLVAGGLSWVFTTLFVVTMSSELLGTSAPFPIGPFQTVSPEIFVVSLVAMTWWNFRRKWVLAFTNAACVLGFLVLLTPAVFVTKPPVPAPGAVHLRIATANVFLDNHELVAANAALASLNVDVLTITEFTEPLEREMENSGVALRYPYRRVTPQDGGEAIALYSRFPFTSSAIVDVGHRPAIRVTLSVDGRAVEMLLIHALPPSSWWESAIWHRELHDLGGLPKRGSTPTIVLGDFNATRWHPYYRRILRRNGLRDVTEWMGDGLGTTWPANWALPPFVRLDHILVRGALVPTAAERRRIPGSDHFALVADLAIA